MSITSLLSLLNTLADFRWDRLKLFGTWVQRWYKPEVLYEVIKNEIELEIVDTQGKVAHYHKRKQVRFQQNNVFALLDTAYGDGKIFVDYSCSPGKAVDFYEEGNCYRVLISLRETKQRGDEEVLHIQRTIQNGYKEDQGYLQTDITYPTTELQVSILFPAKRHPKSVLMIEKNTKNTICLEGRHIKILPDKRCQVSWGQKNPNLHESYILSWKW